MRTLVQAVRHKGYTGEIRQAPTRKPIKQFDGDVKTELEQAYANWSNEFFKQHPNGTLNPSYGNDSLVVRGTGDNGRWLVAWWTELG